MSTSAEQKAAVGTTLDDLVMGFRFAVFFFPLGAIPNPIDIRFKRVSGLGSELELKKVDEGGHNLGTYVRPGRIRHENLVLERGFVVTSPLSLDIDASLTLRRARPSNVMITLLSEARSPICAWLFTDAIPVRWSCGDLDATSDDVLMDTLELSYGSMRSLRL